MRCFLITYDDGTVKRLSVDEAVSRFTVGREERNNIVIMDDRMSREHGTFEVNLDEIVYHDSSRNGSLVNNRVIKNSAVRLYPGDSIELFGATVLYESDGETDETTGGIIIESDTPSIPVVMKGISPQRKLLAAIVIFLVLVVVGVTLALFIRENREMGEDPENISTPAVMEPVDESLTMPDEIPGLIIEEFQAGVITEEDGRFIVIKETDSITREPGTMFGVYFRYELVQDDPVEYVQEEYYPSFPIDWEGWAEKNGNYTPNPDSTSAEYRMTLSPDEDEAARVWYVDENFPLGEMTWDIFFAGEKYRTVTFTIVE